MGVKQRTQAKSRSKVHTSAKDSKNGNRTIKSKQSSSLGKKALLASLLVVAALAAALASYLWALWRAAYPTMHYTDTFERIPTVPFTLPPQHELPQEPLYEADTEKLEAVRTAFLQSWNAYRQHGWGFDEYHPISKSGSNLLGRPDSPLGYTIVDALDMLILHGLQREYEEARDWIRDVLHWDLDGRLNVFETTIRVMGGLLSASALMRDPPPGTLPASLEDADMFQDKAEQLALRLLPAFETPTGIPKREVNLATGESFYDKDNFNSSSLAEATTIQLEFKYLAHLTKNQRYWYLAENPMFFVREATRPPRQGLLPIFLDPQSGVPLLGEVRLGSRGDSYYEYLVKQYLQTNYTEQVYRDMYEHAFNDIKSTLLGQFTGMEPPLLYTMELFPRRVQEQITWARRTKQDHLVCFLGGAMMLGASVHADGTLHPPYNASQATAAMQEDWRVGHELVRSCVHTYTESATGLGAEIVFFQPPTDMKPAEPEKAPLIDSRNILRPETVESLYVAFHLTGDPLYREWGWEIFQAFQRWCQVDQGRGGYAGIDDVDDMHHRQIDRMETFWLSETLKYLHLLFGPRDKISLRHWVFNTEAHPLPVFSPPFPTDLD